MFHVSVLHLTHHPHPHNQFVPLVAGVSSDFVHAPPHQVHQAHAIPSHDPPHPQAYTTEIPVIELDIPSHHFPQIHLSVYCAQD